MESNQSNNWNQVGVDANKNFTQNQVFTESSGHFNLVVTGDVM